ncbi:MAG: hypothetical protein QOJ59_4044, partial [Thermomicrobiales bacterium]|nr:hypothetical protein [Thermomicrobiales bacterium]
EHRRCDHPLRTRTYRGGETRHDTSKTPDWGRTMEFVLVVAFVVAGLVVAGAWMLSGNPALAVVAATTASVVVVAVGDARR